MTTAVLIVNPSPDATRALEFRANNPGAVGYENPWSPVLPGLSACIMVEGTELIEVREGGPVPEGYVAPRPGVLEVRRTDEVTEVSISDSEIIVINGIRFQGCAFAFMAEDANVGKLFRLDSNADGVVQVTELPQMVPANPRTPESPLGQRAIDGVVDSSPVVDSGPGETLPGAAMLTETAASEPDLTIHPEADPVT